MMKRNLTRWWNLFQRQPVSPHLNRTRLQLVPLETRTVPSVVANDDFSPADGSAPIVIFVLANDQSNGPAIDPTSVKIVTSAGHGSTSVAQNGSITYTPNGAFTGTDTFRYTVADTAHSVSNIATVTVVVSRPVANDDIADTDGTNPVTLDILGNDSAPTGATLVGSSVKIVGNPQHGSFTKDPSTGAITYTANPGFGSTDTLQYTVDDSNGVTSNVANISVVVHRPTANDDSGTTTRGQAITVNVLANDTDPDGNNMIDPTSVTLAGGPFHGSASVNHVTGAITYTPNANFTGTDLFTYTIKDFPGAGSNVGAVRITVGTPLGSRVFATGADQGGGPQVNVYKADGTLVRSFQAYASNFTGGVRVAIGDVNADGVPDIVTAPGAGGGPDIRVFDGTTGAMIREFYAYGANFSGGVNVAAGDLNGDGYADIITGAGAGGGPHVKAFSGKDGSVLQSFLAYDSTFNGGVNVAAGDVNGDSYADIVTGAGPTGGPHVKAFDGRLGTTLRSFFAYGAGFTGGVSVAAADVTGDGVADIVTGPGSGGGPNVRVFDGVSNQLVSDFLAYGASFTGGIRVGLEDENGDGYADIVTSPAKGGGPNVRVFDATSGVKLRDFNAYDPGFLGGVFVGGGF